MEFRARQIAPPKSWERFEDLCHALFKRVWVDPLAQKHGRRGQAQQGVDVFGSPDEDRSVLCGVQCKGKDANYGARATCDELIAEIAKADGFSPKLTHWVFATTAPSDATLQAAARELSVKRTEQGLFTVTVLGWEEIQALLAESPTVIEEFYPEAAFDLPAILRELQNMAKDRGAPNILAHSAVPSVSSIASHGDAVWRVLTFSERRDLGPALMGRPLGPADAATCPRLPEANALVLQLRNAFSARLVGIPGAGKSVCAYQAAIRLAELGYTVLRLTDPESSGIEFPRCDSTAPVLHLVDDAHLMPAATLRRLEEATDSKALILSIHNAVENHGSTRGTVVLDPKRAVRVIAQGLRAERTRTLEAVRRADGDIGERMLDSSLDDRLDAAEATSKLPWQFCFILGGGWKRAKLAADNARAAQADVVLAALAMHQIASRDAVASEEIIGEICGTEGLAPTTVSDAIAWLTSARLILSQRDCRTPHQRFAAVVLHEILISRDVEVRRSIFRIAECMLSKTSYPLAGLRNLLHEFRFGHGNYRWASQRPFEPTAIHRLAHRCWQAEVDEDRNFAALVLDELEAFLDEWPKTLIAPMKSVFAQWIASPGSAGYGLGRLLNSLHQRDDVLRKEIISSVAPHQLADAFSTVDPERAYGLSDLARSAYSSELPDWTTSFARHLDRNALLAIAANWNEREQAFLFASICYTTSWYDDQLALDMAEAYIPTAQNILSSDPLGGFRSLDDIAMGVLRVFDVLEVFTGKLKPDARRWKIARAICTQLDSTRLAKQLSEVRPRKFQEAAFFLSFLFSCSARKFSAVIAELDWSRLSDTLGADWSNLSHEAEILVGVMYSGQAKREAVTKFVADNAYRIDKFPPRLAVVAPDIALKHLEAGREIRLTQYSHVDWDYGAFVVQLVAERRPHLMHRLVTPHERTIAQALSGQNSSWFQEAGVFIKLLRDHAASNLSSILSKLNVAHACKGWAESLKKPGPARISVALLVDAALKEPGAVGLLARDLRKRFPTASVPTAEPQLFARHRRRPRRG